MGVNERKSLSEMTQQYKKTTGSKTPRANRSKLTNGELEQLVAFGKTKAHDILIKYVESKRPELMESILKSNKSREEKLDDILRIEGMFQLENYVLAADKFATVELKLRKKQNEQKD